MRKNIHRINRDDYNKYVFFWLEKTFYYLNNKQKILKRTSFLKKNLLNRIRYVTVTNQKRRPLGSPFTVKMFVTAGNPDFVPVSGSGLVVAAVSGTAHVLLEMLYDPTRCQ